MLRNKTVGNLVEELLTQCRKSISSGLTAPVADYPWENFEAVHDLVQKLLLEQSKISGKAENGSLSFGHFLKQSRDIQGFKKYMLEICPDCGLDEFLDIQQLEDGSLGLVALKDLSSEVNVLKVPRVSMMTSPYLTPSNGDGSSNDVILTRLFESEKQLFTEVPSLQITMVLLKELFQDNSKWKSYINILPKHYNMPLYFSKDTFKTLHNSITCSDLILCLFRNVTRQYCIIFKRLRNQFADSNLAKNFSYEAFRWAVSTVMSRQNKIPHQSNSKIDQLALIPLWDLANHREAHMTTFYDLESDSIKCLPTEELKSGEKFEIHYGNRPNSSFMIYQGFVPGQNKHDQVDVRLGISTNDPLSKTKNQLLFEHHIPSSGKFSLHTSYHEIPFSRDVLIFARIFNLDKDEIGLIMLKKTELVEERSLGNLMFAVTPTHEEKVWKFLSMRCSLLARRSSKAIESLTWEKEAKEMTEETELVRKLLLTEVAIFDNVKCFADRMLKTLTTNEEAFKFIE